MSLEFNDMLLLSKLKREINELCPYLNFYLWENFRLLIEEGIEL